MRTLRKLLAGLGVVLLALLLLLAGSIAVYPGVGHAFVGGIDEIQAGGAPGEAWAEFLAWLEQTIGS